METLLNVNQAAFILKVHPLTIRRYIREQKLKAVRIGGNIRIKESDLQGFNKDIIPGENPKTTKIEKIKTLKMFTSADPLFHLEGRGAHVTLS